MQKVIRDGKVAVLYSPGYGAGWYTWHYNLELVFHPVLVDLVEQGKHKEITEKLIKSLGITDNPYLGGIDKLTIAWVNQGDKFQIEEYNGVETIVLQEEFQWLEA